MAVWDADSPAGRFLLEVGAENVVLQQQYRDFLIFRRFRQTLLCREDASARSGAQSRSASIALRRREHAAETRGPRHRIGRAGALRGREGRGGDDDAPALESRVSRARSDLAALDPDSRPSRRRPCARLGGRGPCCHGRGRDASASLPPRLLWRERDSTSEHGVPLRDGDFGTPPGRALLPGSRPVLSLR